VLISVAQIITAKRRDL